MNERKWDLADDQRSIQLDRDYATNGMEKTIILIILTSLLMHGCNQPKSDFELVNQFYSTYRNYNFGQFGCMNIVHWNQHRKYANQEYLVEIYSGCDNDNYTLLGRGTLNFKNEIPYFESNTIQNMNLNLLKEFKKLNISTLFCKGENKISITIYPNIRIFKNCKKRINGFIMLDSCWQFKINNSK